MRIAQWGLAAMFFGMVTAAGADTQPLLLEIWVNGRTNHVVAPVVARDGAFWAARDDLTASGIKLARNETGADNLVDLSTLNGVSARLNPTDQKLEIAAPQSRIAPQVFDLMPTAPQRTATGASGVTLLYDVAATAGDLSHFGQSTNLGALLGGTYFSPWANFTTNGIFEANSSFSRATRLDSTIEFDEPDGLRHILIGDAITGGLDWSRPLRFAGIQIARDFGLRPDLVTMPLPAFYGDAAVPSTVDVFVNAAHVFETAVDPGPFEINNIPVLTGGGEASIVVRDALGQQTTVRLPYFASDALLQTGLSDYAFDAGFVRRGYGLESFDYGDAIADGTYRYGLRDWVTLEAHGEASSHVREGGAGAAFSLGAFGVAQIAGAASDTGSHRGALVSVSVDSQYKQFGFFGSVIATSGDYADLASLDAPPPARLQLQIGANVSLGEMGSLTASWIEVHRDGRTPSRLATASYSVPFGRRWFFGTTGFYDCVNRNWAAEFFLSLALDDGALAQATARTSAQGSDIGGAYIKNADPDGGFGYRALASTGENDVTEADATWIGQHGTLDAGLSSLNGTVAARMLVSGAVVAIDGSVYATRMPDGAVALVRTGQEGVHITRENRTVAVSDSDGEALLTGLTPYTENRIAIDPNDYNLATIANTTQKIVVPRRAGGVIVDLTPVSRHPALLVLRLEDGSDPPLGSRVTLDGRGEPLDVGRGGEVFVPDLPARRSFTLTMSGGTCRFTVTPPAVPASDAIPKLGPIVCTKESAA